MQPSAPHHTIAPFLVWTADDLSKTKLANTALIYGALDGLRAAARGGSPLSGVASSWDTRLLHGHGRSTLRSAVLTHFCSLGFHTLGHTVACLFQAARREQSETSISRKLF